MKTHKLLSYAARLNRDGKEIFLLCPDKETAESAVNELMRGHGTFDPSQASLVKVDMSEYVAPTEIH